MFKSYNLNKTKSHIRTHRQMRLNEYNVVIKLIIATVENTKTFTVYNN